MKVHNAAILERNGRGDRIHRSSSVPETDVLVTRNSGMTPLFDSPQWNWRISREKLSYGVGVQITNEVMIYPMRGSNSCVNVEIPSQFFSLVVSGFPTDKLKLMEATPLFFALEDIGGGRWLFSYVIGEEYHPLWVYTKSTMPLWADKYTRR